MTTPFLDLLRQIADGVVIHEPFRRTTNELRVFQHTVRQLREMGRLGLIAHFFTPTGQHRRQ